MISRLFDQQDVLTNKKAHRRSTVLALCGAKTTGNRYITLAKANNVQGVSMIWKVVDQVPFY